MTSFRVDFEWFEPSFMLSADSSARDSDAQSVESRCHKYLPAF